MSLLTMRQPTLLCYQLHGRPSFPNSFHDLFRSLVSEALHPPAVCPRSQKRTYGGLIMIALTFAESVVRIRVRRRIVSVHVQRRQVRIVRVVATTEATHDGKVQPPCSTMTDSPCRLCASTSPHPATPIRMCCRNVAWFSVFGRQHLCLMRDGALRARLRRGCAPHFPSREQAHPFSGVGIAVPVRLTPRFDNRCRKRSS